MSVEKSLQIVDFDQNGVEIHEQWSPIEGVLKALRKIHKGIPLAFRDEVSLQSCLDHEIQHSVQQKFARVIDNLGPADKVLMETMIEWKSRRDYPAFLKKLGVEARMTEKVQKHGYGYPKYIENFDALLAFLEIKDKARLHALLDSLREIIATKSPNTYNEHVSKVLRGLVGASNVNIEDALANIGSADFADRFLK